MTTLTEIAGVLNGATRVVAFCHVAPDGDAIGSLLGFGWLLDAPGRQIVLVSADGVPEELRFLPGADRIQTRAPDVAWNAVVALDASDPRRLGEPFRPETYNDAPILNMDHHVTNLRFGDFNYVDPSAAATAQIMVDLADALPTPISHNAAVCLLTGLATDTLGFRTSNVTPQVMQTAVRLMETGVDLSMLISRTLAARPVNAMKLWGLALADLQIAGRVIWAAVSNAMRAQAGATEDGESGLVSFLVGAPEADIAAVFSETPEGAVEIGFRTRPGFDVSKLALALGGGGHPQASGCTIDGPLSAAQERVIPMLIALAAAGPTRERLTPMMDGILNVDKPVGWTSHDVVGFLRRRLGVKKMGHAGTLDPFATGVLVVCMGQATRVAEYLTASVKAYRAVAELGLTTDTYDVDGAVQSRSPIPPLSEDDLRRALTAFEGEIEQYPPAYSAIKQDGVPAYRRARRGEQVELPARIVHIHEIRLLAWHAPHLEFEVICEAGTYIRSIAHDLGQQLGCGATLMTLTRTRSGPFRVEDALSPDALAEAAATGNLATHVHALREALYNLTPVQINAEEAARLVQGQAIAAAGIPAEHTGYALDADAQVRAILRYDAAERLWRPAKVFTPSAQE